MIKIFYLLRHGQRIKKIGDQPLSLLGKQQSMVTATYFSQQTIDCLVASPLLRTRQTANFLQKKLQLPICIDTLIRERTNWGDDPYQTSENFMHNWKKAVIDRDWQPQVGDSSKVSGSRLESAIRHYANTDKKYFVFVTHGGIITDFILNIFPREKINKISSNFFTKYDKTIHECSITIIKFNYIHDNFSLACLGTVNHLSQDMIDTRYSVSDLVKVEN